MTNLPSQQQFEELVVALMSPNNEFRKEAEAYYEELKKDSGWVCMAFLAVMKMSTNDVTQYMCSILLRRLLEPSEKVFINLGSAQQNAVKNDLVELFTSTKFTRQVRKGITGCMAAVVLSLSGTEGWDEVVPFLLTAVENGNSDIRLACALVFKQVATVLVDKFMASSHVGNFCSAMVKCMQDPLFGVRVAAVEALAQFIAVMNEGDSDKLRSLIPVVLQCMQDTLNRGDQESVGLMLDPLVFIADNNVEFFGKYIGDVVTAMMAIASQEGILQSLKTYAVEFMLSFCERAPKIARNVPHFVRGFFELCLKFSSYPPEREDWAVSYEEDENPDEICDYDIGLEGMDRLACALKGKCLEPIATEFILRNANSPDWHLRQSALMAIGQISEGCHDAFVANLTNITTLLLNNLHHDHIRVRYACMASIAQMFTDFTSDMEEEYERLVPAIIGMLRDPVPRIQAIAAAAICNFSDSADSESVEKCASDFLQNVCTLLNNTPHIFVKEQCLAAISSVAENSGESFAQFYDRLMPILKPLLHIDDRREYRLCKCRALEALTLMAVSVGKEKFAPDADGVCQYIAQQQCMDRESDDPFMRYLVRGWSCMAKTLKRDFSPYLKHALTPVMRILDAEVSMEVVGESEDTGEEEEGVQIISLCIKGLGDKKVKLHTALIEDKIMAMTMLLACIEETEDGILPFMDDVVSKITPLLLFPYVDDVRETSAQAAALCVKTARAFSQANGGKHDQANVDLSIHFMKEILKALRKEAETTCATEFLAAMHIILENTPQNFLPQAALDEICTVMRQVFEESIKRRQELFQEMEGEDDEDLDNIMEEHEDEETLLIEAVDVIGRLLKTQEIFYPAFVRDFLPNFAELLDERAGNTEHKIALCVLDDFVDLKPDLALNFFPQISGAMIKYATADNHEVMQAASFGCGLIAELMGRDTGVRNPDLAIQMAQAMLKNLLTDPEQKTEAYLHAMANVASALLKIMRNFSNELKAQEPTLMKALIQRLPYQMDEVEAKFIHRTLFDLSRSGHPVVVAEEKRILAALRAVKDSAYLDKEVKDAL